MNLEDIKKIKKRLIEGLLTYYTVGELGLEVEGRIGQSLGDDFLKACRNILEINQALKSLPFTYGGIFQELKFLRQRAFLSKHLHKRQLLFFPTLSTLCTRFVATNKERFKSSLPKLPQELLQKIAEMKRLSHFKFYSQKDINLTILSSINDSDLTFLAIVAALVDDIAILKKLTEEINIIDVMQNRTFVLYYAAREGHLEICKFLIEDKKVPVDQDREFGNTPFLKAASNGHFAVCEYLLQQGANYNEVNDNGESALFCAARGGLLEVCKFLIEQEKFSVDACNKNGTTPFLVAASNGHFAVCEYLLQRGANYNEVNKNGESALFCAAREGQLRICEFLIEQKKVSVNDCDKKGNSPFLIATSNGHSAVCEYLVEQGADCKKTNTDGESGFFIAIIKGYEKIVTIFLKKQWIEVDEKIITNSTSQVGAGSFFERMYYALKERESFAQEKEFALTPLQYAIWALQTEVCKLLCEAGADVTICDSRDGGTLWHLLVERNLYQYDDDVIKPSGLIRERHAVPNQNSLIWIENSGGYNSKTSKVLAIAKLLPKELINQFDNYGYSPLHRAVYGSDNDLCKLLIEAGADIHLITQEEGNTVLHLLAAGGHPNSKLHRFFLENGVSINARNKKQETPLFIAADLYEFFEIYKSLQQRGVDIDFNVKDVDGNTLLHRAALGALNFCEFFLDLGLEVNAKNHLGQTPLHVAAKSDASGIIPFLVERGADLCAVDSEGKTPFDYALAKSQEEDGSEEALNEIKDLMAAKDLMDSLPKITLNM